MIMSCPALIRTIARQRSTSSIRHHYNYASPGSYQANLVQLWKERDFHTRGFTVGIGGPVGSGKTALVQALCDYFPQMGVVTNDIFTQEDAEFLIKHSNLPSSHVRAVETGGCPHSAIREDISINVTALEELHKDLMLCESGGDNLAVNFSRELADLTIYVIDVAGGDKVPRKGGPGITESDLLVINKIDLADAVGADLELMEGQANDMRTKQNPVYMVSVKHKNGVDRIADFIQTHYDKAMSV